MGDWSEASVTMPVSCPLCAKAGNEIKRKRVKKSLNISFKNKESGCRTFATIC
jgi:hypothetical protein